MNEEKKKVETKFFKQNYEIIKKYSKESKINYKDYSQEILTNIFNNFKEKKLFYLFYSNIRQIEFLLFTNKGHSSDVFKAIQNGEIERVKYFIESCFYSFDEVDEQGKTVLSYCLESNNKEIQNYLFSKQTKIDFQPIKEKPTDYESDIFKACEEGKLTSVQW